MFFFFLVFSNIYEYDVKLAMLYGHLRTDVPPPGTGIGRILYSLLEHSFSIRKAEDGAEDGGMRRGVMSFRPLVAPIKCAVFPLSSQASFLPLCARAMDALGHLHIRYKRMI